MKGSILDSRFSKKMQLFITIFSLVLLLALAAFVLALCYEDTLRAYGDYVWMVMAPFLFFLTGQIVLVCIVFGADALDMFKTDHTPTGDEAAFYVLFFLIIMLFKMVLFFIKFVVYSVRIHIECVRMYKTLTIVGWSSIAVLVLAAVATMSGLFL